MEDWPDEMIEDYDPSSSARIELTDIPTPTVKGYHPVILEFQIMIETDPHLYMLFHQMFEQVVDIPTFAEDSPERRQARNYHEMLAFMNMTLRRAPTLNVVGGCPFSAMLLQVIGTPAGKAAFLSPTVNKALRRILQDWSRYLASADSRYVISKEPQSGWLGRDAMARMPLFQTTYVCDPQSPHYGFTSWDDFFTRRLRPGARPISAIHDDNVIINACESAPLRLAHDVKLRDTFWLKSQPYSVEHMLAADPLAQHFAGGTVYQAYLDEVSYHRWHSPLTGTIVKAFIQEGTYYSRCPAEGSDQAVLIGSQAYLAQMATRAILFIKAKNPAIGLVCFLAIGMLEVSSCEIGVYEGQEVEKGDELGTFHYGGSTYCLLFRAGVPISFDLGCQTPALGARNLPVNATIATIHP